MNVFTPAACAALLLISCNMARQPQSPEKVRLSKIVADSAQRDSYKAFLKEETEASVSKEPGVLTLYALPRRPTTRRI